MERDFYQVLGVVRTATRGEIRATYVRLVKRHHPDVAGRLPSRLRDVQQAYRCLADPELRAEHDRRIAENERAHHAQQRLVQRQLGQYDSRSHRCPRSIRRRRWRTVLIAAIGIGLFARMSLGLF
ncbi:MULTISPECIES: DnaJ domain-containing protein [unclassified Sphingomonas]|uniref:J domain-containing protein n=1 Tax=unclassified Sphingomonas TaxID=196159 RepID=UPI00226B960B|nr:MULTISPECIES: DnaJ domain-containing protein [unclassified Sphingomonas]